MASLSGVTRKYAKIGETTRIQYISGIFPSTAATADVAVGELNAEDDVIVKLTDPVGSWAKPMIELRGSRTTGESGKIVLGTSDSSNSPATGYVDIRVEQAIHY